MNVRRMPYKLSTQVVQQEKYKANYVFTILI